MEPGTGSTNGRHGDAFWTVLVAIVGSSLFSGLTVTRADFATSSRPTLAQSTPTRSLRMLHDDLIDGQLDDFSLLEAALRCGGVGDVREIRQFEGSFSDWLQPVARRIESMSSRREQARELLHALHRRWCFGAFDAPCARLDHTMRYGRYNCVTTVILFRIAADRLGWKSRAISVPGHVFVRIGNDVTLDVQTTCRTWLDPVERRPLVPTGPERVLSEVQLLAKLRYNAGVIALGRSRYEDAAVAFRQALAWDPQDRSAAQNLVASYNNGALRLCQLQRHRDAIDFIERALRIDPRLRMLRDNEVYIYQSWLGFLSGTGRADAATELARFLQRHPRPYLRNQAWNWVPQPSSRVLVPGVSSRPPAAP